MTRKRSHYRPRLKSAPMLVSRGIIEDAIALIEQQIAPAFTGGYATTEHFDQLCDMRNVLTIAANYKNDESGRTICEAMRIPMGNLRDRYAKTGRFGLTGDELQIVNAFIDYYRDFWIRQPTALYEKACDEITAFNLSLAKERKAA